MNRQFQPEDRQLALELAHCAEQAAEEVHCIILATKEVSRIRETIDSREWNRMWTALQEFLDRYKFLILASSPVTNITLIRLTPDQVARITTDDLIVQLRIVIGFVFAHHAIHSVNRLAFQQCFRRLTNRYFPRPFPT